MNAPTAAPEPLPAGYYLDNFNELTGRVVACYEDLLSRQELEFHATFQQLSSPARFLYLRMLMRKGDFFRAGKLQYREIPDQPVAARELQRHELIRIDPPLTMQDCLPLFNKGEWLQWLDRHCNAANAKREAHSVIPAHAGIQEPVDSEDSEMSNHGLRRNDNNCRNDSSCGNDDILRRLKQARRQQLDEFLLQQFGDAPAIEPGETIFQLQQAHIFDVFRLLYFGNPRQDLTEFILRDLQITRFEAYPLARETRRFQQRRQIEQHLHLYRMLELLPDVLTADAQTILDFHELLPEAANDDPRLQSKLEKITLQLARQLERLQQPEAAMQMYRSCNCPPARERQARLLATAGEFDAALQLCETIAADPRHEQELEFGHNFGSRTARRLGRTVTALAPLAACLPSERLLRLPQSDLRVELQVARHLVDEGVCYYVENSLLTGVFGLLYWEVVFVPVAGAFSHPFQYRPHDLYEPDFLQLRRAYFERVDACLQEAKETLPADRILQCFRDKYGIANRLVHWAALSEDLLQLALQRIPAAHWRAVFRRLWADLRNNCSGLPDLVLFPDSGSYRLIEVKAPGDRLQTNQRRWMRCFAEHGIPHEVARVEWV